MNKDIEDRQDRHNMQDGKDRITVEELYKIIRMAEKDIDSAPPGILYAIQKGNKYQYYCRQDGKPRVYLKRSEDDIARKLAQKEYAQKVYKMAKHDIRVLEIADKLHYRRDYFCCSQKITDGKQSIIDPYIYDDTAYADAWENDKREFKESRKDTRAHALSDAEEDAVMTDRGEIVRSKSEKIIADKLYRAGVPYIYEFPVNLNGIGYVRPDLYVLNVRTREDFYWEHFGMMDNPEYSGNAVRKVEMYEKNGIFPGRSLILTYETSDHPISSRIIDEIIAEYLK